MLSILSKGTKHTRREMLRIGGLGLGGLSLSHLLAARSAGAVDTPITTGKSVIFLLQQGGPSQHETFDPKTLCPEAVRTIGGTTQTSIPGVHFGATLSRLSKFADKLAVVRSFSTGNGGHNLQPLVGKASHDANIGAYYARLAGANHPETGIPTNVLLTGTAVEPDGLGADTRFGNLKSAGDLGKAAEAFAPGGGSALQDDMKLSIPEDRFFDRRRLLSALDRMRREIDTTQALEGVDRFRQQAYEMLFKGVAGAFDLSREDPQTIARYDTGQFVRPVPYYEKKSNGEKGRMWYQAHARTLGKLLLLARRLCEAGCGFVTVTTRFVWDMHADRNNLGVERGMEAVGQPFDHAVSAFIEDCEQRGLSNDILLVTTGEMGRTPKVNSRGRPRPLEPFDAAHALRRRRDARPGDRPFEPRRRRAGDRTVRHRQPDRHDHAQPVRYRRTAGGARRAGRSPAADFRRGADTRVVVASTMDAVGSIFNGPPR